MKVRGPQLPLTLIQILFILERLFGVSNVESVSGIIYMRVKSRDTIWTCCLRGRQGIQNCPVNPWFLLQVGSNFLVDGGGDNSASGVVVYLVADTTKKNRWITLLAMAVNQVSAKGMLPCCLRCTMNMASHSCWFSYVWLLCTNKMTMHYESFGERLCSKNLFAPGNDRKKVFWIKTVPSYLCHKDSVVGSIPDIYDESASVSNFMLDLGYGSFKIGRL